MDDSRAVLVSPAVTDLIAAETPLLDPIRGQVQRTASSTIKEEGEDLREAANETLNVILDLDLDGKIRWASPSWQDVVGSLPDSWQGKPIADLLIDEQKSVFADAIRTLREETSGSKVVHFQIDRAIVGRIFGGGKDADQNNPEEAADAGEDLVDLEAQGIMLYDRTTGAESHTMWMIRPFIQREVTIDLPDILVESLGEGAEMLAHHLTQLAEAGLQDPEHNPPPLPVLCRICERQITPWWLPKHTELCLQEHQAEADLQMTQENLTEHRTAIVNVLDGLEAHNRYRARSPNEEKIPPPPEVQYKGVAIGSSSTTPSGVSSPTSQPGSRPSSGLAHHRARSFAVRRPLSLKVELILDLCDTALEISPPSIKEQRTHDSDEIRTQSPQSEGRVSQVLQWSPPSTENEPGLSNLCEDTNNMARAKVDAVMFFRRILEYSETIRAEITQLVQDCIDAAMQKAAKIAAGEISSSESSDESIENEDTNEDDRQSADAPKQPQTNMPPPLIPTRFHNESDSDSTQKNASIPDLDRISNPSLTHLDGPSAMSVALRQLSTRSPSPAQSQRRRDSLAVSTRSNSPKPGILYHPQPVSVSSSLKPNDLPLNMDPDMSLESDGSARSSVRSLPRQNRSPSVENTLTRVRSSRERKRTSLVLPQRPRSRSRNQSPGREPSQPASPLRVNKPRLPSGAVSAATDKSPISPVLQSSEFCSPDIPAHIPHHRRQSSAASSELSRAALSPRLNIAAPPPKALPPSIRDFEIIKPISKGAFGSVYLAKKKNTGDYYAIKALRKQDMVAKNQVANVKAERAILMFQGESDFVAKLYWTFPSKDYIFLVMEYLNGGDCASLIQSLGTLPEDWAKRYMAEVVQGVDHLHSREIVHRDLKPDNLLIDQNGHLKLTDFGLSRMGLIGRQKRALNNKNNAQGTHPDPLKQGPFQHQQRSMSIVSSRSTSLDAQGYHTPGNTPALTPVRPCSDGQPSYFSLSREVSANRERQMSGRSSEGGDIDHMSTSFKRMSINETPSESGRSSPKDAFLKPDEGQGEPLARLDSRTTTYKAGTPPQVSMAMLPPPMALFDPDDSNRRFVGTPDYLAPETINGLGQDEMSDWWSLGCIVFEFLFGYPPFHAETPDLVFENILQRNIHWPEDDDAEVSDEAKDLINRLICLNPSERLGANIGEVYASGGEEIRRHPWFSDIEWDKLNETEASFVPAPENIEDTEYFDARGATSQDFTQEFDDQSSSPATTPLADFERPHDALSRVRQQVNSMKRNLLPLHIPPHVRDNRSRRLSEPAANDDFGQFSFKNLPVLERANKDVIQKLRAEALQSQARNIPAHPTSNATGSTGGPSPPTLESSPIIGLPLKRAISANRGNRSASPSNLTNANSSPSRGSQPSSPLVQFSAGSLHERRKTSSGTSAPQNAPTGFFDIPKLPTSQTQPPLSSSPVKNLKPISKDDSHSLAAPGGSPRARSHTVGSADSESATQRAAHHRKRRSQVVDISPSSSDTEDPRQKALLRVQRRRQSSRRLSQITTGDLPVFRPLDLLVVEDHPVSRMVLERLLGKLRCRVIMVPDGAEAIRYAMSSVKFDIILTEYRLPKINGADLARMLRETKNANSNTPIVAVTGYLKDLPSPHHFEAMIEKPPTAAKLTEVLSRLCQWRPPPPDWAPSAPSLSAMQERLPGSGLRQETYAVEDSPTSTSTTSTYPSLRVFSRNGSSRTDSISSAGVWTDTDSNGNNNHKAEDPTLVISRPTDGNENPSRDWRSGLGISEPNPKPPRVNLSQIIPSLIPHDSAPATLEFAQAQSPIPRKQPSSEFIEAKKKMLAETRERSGSTGDTGDDEDEELGQGEYISLRRSRSRSPSKMDGGDGDGDVGLPQYQHSLLPGAGSSVGGSVSLSTEMIRTESQGSVIGPLPIFPPKNIGVTNLPHFFEANPGNEPRHLSNEFDLAKDDDAVHTGAGLTPPEIFPLEPGSKSKIIQMDPVPVPGPNAGPRAEHDLVSDLTNKLLQTKIQEQTGRDLRDTELQLARSPPDED